MVADRHSSHAALWSRHIASAGRLVADSLRLMVGVPNYGTYLEHMKTTHPGEPAMDYQTFFLERQRARYEGGRGRCC